MVVLKVKKLNKLQQKLKGLIGLDKIQPVFFQTRFGIHTFGVKQPIDILILDNSFRIRKAHPLLKPNRVLFWNPLYNKVAELPPYTISKFKLKKGQLVKFDFQ